MAATFRFEALPAEVFNGVVGFLIGCDVLTLSHVNHLLLTELLAPDCGLWTQRALCSGPTDNTATAKQRYFQIRTFRFGGLPIYPPNVRVDWQTRRKAEYGGAVPFDFTVESVMGRSSFSIGVWFALLPGGLHAQTGDIVLGAQANPYRNGSGRAINHDMQFIHVDPESNLYCSVAKTKTIVASNLEAERWYYLVLVFDKPTPASLVGTESVFLDGQLLRSGSKKLSPGRGNTPYWQVGSGYMGGARLGEPSAHFRGWYGFYGMIDELAIWKQALSSDQVQELYRGRDVHEVEPFWTLRRAQNLPAFEGIVHEVACTRPQERHCVLHSSRGPRT